MKHLLIPLGLDRAGLFGESTIVSDLLEMMGLDRTEASDGETNSSGVIKILALGLNRTDSSGKSTRGALAHDSLCKLRPGESF